MNIGSLIKDKIRSKKDEFFGREDLETRTANLKKEREITETKSKRREEFRSQKQGLKDAKINELKSKFGINNKAPTVKSIKKEISEGQKKKKNTFGRGFGTVDDRFKFGK